MGVGRFGVLVAGMSFVLAAHGCGDDSTPKPEPKPRVCVPGTVYSCFRGGCAGRQSCSSDGTEMSRCSCDRDRDDDAGEPADASPPEPVDAAEPVDASAVDAAEPEQCDGELACERAAAASFNGPIALRASESSTPNCEGSFGETAFEAGETPEAAAASCSSCTCSPATEACAAFVNFDTGSEAACGGTLCTTSVNQSCAEIMPPCLAGSSSAQLRTSLPAGGGGCTPSQPAADKPEVTWARRVIGCSAAPRLRDGCSTSELCLPKLPSADEKLCVWREGEHDCPSERYTDKRVYFREVEDTRGCAACSCSGPNCSYTWSVFNAGDTACTAPIIELTSAGQCVQVNPSADKLRVGASIGGDGACSPSGGASQGGVSGSEPVTVCCKP